MTTPLKTVQLAIVSFSTIAVLTISYYTQFSQEIRNKAYEGPLDLQQPPQSQTQSQIQAQTQLSIDKPQVKNITQNSATITTATSIPSTLTINYHTPQGTIQSLPVSKEPTTAHSIKLINLDSRQTYHFTLQTPENSSNSYTFRTQ